MFRPKTPVEPKNVSNTPSRCSSFRSYSMARSWRPDLYGSFCTRGSSTAMLPPITSIGRNRPKDCLLESESIPFKKIVHWEGFPCFFRALRAHPHCEILWIASRARLQRSAFAGVRIESSGAASFFQHCTILVTKCSSVGQLLPSNMYAWYVGKQEQVSGIAFTRN